MIYIPIEKEFLPEQFEMQLGEEMFNFKISYNSDFDFFTIDVSDVDLNPIVLGEKLVLNQPLWSDIIDKRLPAPSIIPADSSGKAARITFDNFMETVFLVIDSEGAAEDGNA